MSETTEILVDRLLVLFVALSFCLGLAVMFRRTWKWDWLGISLGILFGTFGLAYFWVDLSSIYPEYGNVWARWTVRSMILVAVLNFDAALILTPAERYTAVDLEEIDRRLARLDEVAARLERLTNRQEISTDATETNRYPPGAVPVDGSG